MIPRTVAASLLLATIPTLLAQGPTTGTLLADLATDPNPAPRSSDPWLAGTDGTHTWFAATTPATGLALWRTDGTVAGTVAIDGLGTGSAASFRALDRRPDGTLLLAAGSAATGIELFALGA